MKTLSTTVFRKSFVPHFPSQRWAKTFLEISIKKVGSSRSQGLDRPNLLGRVFSSAKLSPKTCPEDCQPRKFQFSQKVQIICSIILLSLLLTTGLPLAVMAQRQNEAMNVYLPLVTSSKESAQTTAPVIHNFSANPININAGETVTLAWQVSDASKVSISGVGDVTGNSITVQPTTTTVYTMIATNGVTSVTAKTTVTVNAASVIEYANYFLPYLFDGNIQQSLRPQVAVDAGGGIHVAYTLKNGVGGYYGYCAANCTSTANFHMVNLGAELFGLQLRLNATGQPRLLYALNQDGHPNFVYAECNANCLDAAQWRASASIAEGSYAEVAEGDDIPAFALDAQGRPRFVYLHNETNGDVQIFYTYCDANCTIVSQWQQTQLSDKRWAMLQLAFTATGLPRLAFFANPYLDDGVTLVPQIDYLECNTADCSAISGPVQVATTPTSPTSAPQMALRLDRNGHPRLALYPGSGEGGNLQSGRLFYVTCDTNCTGSSDQWAALDIGLPGLAGDGSEIYDGELGVDLALDAQDHPHIAYRVSVVVAELGYTYCSTTTCGQTMNGWRHVLFAAREDVDQELGHIRLHCDNCIPPLPDCQSFWNAGMWPSLALDATGNPRIAFEVQLWSFGGCSVEVMARLPRMVLYQVPP